MAAAIANCCVMPQAASARKYPLKLFAEMANAVLDSQTGKMLTYRQLLKRDKYKDEWTHSLGKEFECLAQGIGGRIPNPMNTIFFIKK